MRLTSKLVLALGLTAIVGLMVAPASFGRQYKAKIANLTSGQPLTPPVVAAHRGRHAIFDVGEAASFGVQQVAENGNNAPLLEALDASNDVFRAFDTDTGPLVPNGTPGAAEFDRRVKFSFRAPRRARRLSFVSMLICTNDGFTGVDSVKLPRKAGKAKRHQTNAYDAGTEINTEDYADIVPPCQALIGDSSGEPGTGETNPALAEGGVIHRHAGVVGGEDLDPELHGWTDPVAKIKVKRVKRARR